MITAVPDRNWQAQGAAGLPPAAQLGWQSLPGVPYADWPTRLQTGSSFSRWGTR